MRFKGEGYERERGRDPRPETSKKYQIEEGEIHGETHDTLIHCNLSFLPQLQH